MSSPTWTSTSRRTWTSFLPLVAPILSGHSELAIGTRLGHGAHIRRRLRREILSRGYNAIDPRRLPRRLQRCAVRLQGDSQPTWLGGSCRSSSTTAGSSTPSCSCSAERNGLRIHEVPVDWIEDLDSRVDLVSTIAADLHGLWRVRRSFWRGEGVALGAGSNLTRWVDRAASGGESPAVRRAGADTGIASRSRVSSGSRRRSTSSASIATASPTPTTPAPCARCSELAPLPLASFDRAAS